VPFTNHLAQISPRRAIAVITLIALAALAGCTHQRPSQSLREEPPPTGVPSSQPLAPPEPVDAAYRADVERIVATRLHLTVPDITHQLRAQPNSTLMNLAKPLGLAQDQLSATIASAFATADNDATLTRHLTTAQADQLTRYWSSQPDASRITEVSYWYLHDQTPTG
jgi:hypothetical protein